MPVSQLKTELYYTSIAQLVPTGKLWNIISCNLSLSSCGSIPAVSISELFVATNLTNRDNNESNKCTNQSYHKYESFANTIALPVQMCIGVVSLIKRITWMINSSQLPHHGPVVKWRKSLDRHFFGNNVPAERLPKTSRSWPRTSLCCLFFWSLLYVLISYHNYHLFKLDKHVQIVQVPL